MNHQYKEIGSRKASVSIIAIGMSGLTLSGAGPVVTITSVVIIATGLLIFWWQK